MEKVKIKIKKKKEEKVKEGMQRSNFNINQLSFCSLHIDDVNPIGIKALRNITMLYLLT